MSLTGRCWKLMALIWKVMETLGGGAWLTDVSHRGLLWEDVPLRWFFSTSWLFWVEKSLTCALQSILYLFVSGTKQRIQLTCFKISGSTSWYEIFLFLNSFRYLHYFHIHPYVYHFTASLLSLQFVYRNI